MKVITRRFYCVYARFAHGCYLFSVLTQNERLRLAMCRTVGCGYFVQNMRRERMLYRL
jgi:hypothetical protein